MRSVEIKRKTNEVDIKGVFNIDGAGVTDLNTGVAPLNHLLAVFAFHGLFDLNLKAAGDLQHHLVEDIGIALGKAVKQSLGEKEGINRYGCFSVVMDKVAVEVNVDISGRPSLKSMPSGIDSLLAAKRFDDSNFTLEDAEEFLESFVNHAGISFIYIVKSEEGDLHHILEALFKAFGKALDQATQIDPRREGVPSTKGIID